MLSILIPSYNYRCTRLVRALRKQAKKASFPVEIIVMDDASTDEDISEINRQIASWNNCYFLENSYNEGRASIRNDLAEIAKYELLLFMDCDAGVVTNDFLESYVAAWKEGSVVCGGLLYQRPLQNPENTLRYLYGTHVEERSAAKRSLNPYDGFTTFSFLISRSLFLQIRFNNSFIGYGHEDTAFGYELQKRQIPIVHIDNPLYHLGLESNEIFLSKTESSVANLLYASRKLPQNMRLLQAYRKVCDFKLRTLMAVCFRIIRPFLRWNLLSNHPNLTLFDVYKLGFLCSLSGANNNIK